MSRDQFIAEPLQPKSRFGPSQQQWKSSVSLLHLDRRGCLNCNCGVFTEKTGRWLLWESMCMKRICGLRDSLRVRLQGSGTGSLLTTVATTTTGRQIESSNNGAMPEF